jgi:hypothetical protein
MRAGEYAVRRKTGLERFKRLSYDKIFKDSKEKKTDNIIENLIHKLYDCPVRLVYLTTTNTLR